jgi:hypothetical protein
MINEEDYIRSKMGNKNPFTVPEGYFEQLAGDIMNKIPANVQKEQKPALIKRLRPLLYAAACVCIAMFGVVIYQNLDKQGNDTLNANIISHNAAEYNDKFMEDAADYAMIDNDEIYASLLADM